MITKRSLFMSVTLLFVLVAPVVSARAEESAAWAVAKGPDNAALVYYRALLVFNSAKDGAEDKAQEAFFDDGSYDAAALDPLVERNAEALAILHQAAAIPGCDFGVQFDMGYRAALPELARLRALARIPLLAARKAFNADEDEKAVGLICDTLQMARHVRAQGNLIYALVSVTIVHTAYHQMPTFLSSLAGNDALLARIEESVNATAAAQDEWRDAFEGERKAIASYMPSPDGPPSAERLAEAVGDFGGEASDAGAEDRRVFQLLAADQVSAEDLAKLAALLKCDVEDVQTPEGRRAVFCAQAIDTMQRLNRLQEIIALPYPEVAPQMAAVIDEIPPGNVMAAMLLAPLAKLANAKARNDSRLAMMQCAIAILRWRTAHGRLPQGLDEVDALPSDPFTNGEPFAYRVIDDGAFSVTGKATEHEASTEPLTLTIRVTK